MCLMVWRRRNWGAWPTSTRMQCMLLVHPFLGIVGAQLTTRLQVDWNRNPEKMLDILKHTIIWKTELYNMPKSKLRSRSQLSFRFDSCKNWYVAKETRPSESRHSAADAGGQPAKSANPLAFDLLLMLFCHMLSMVQISVYIVYRSFVRITWRKPAGLRPGVHSRWSPGCEHKSSFRFRFWQESCTKWCPRIPHAQPSLQSWASQIALVVAPCEFWDHSRNHLVTFGPLHRSRLWRGFHFGIARESFSALLACQISLVVARCSVLLFEILCRDLGKEVFGSELAQRSCHGDLFWRSCTETLPRSCQESSFKELVQRSLTQILPTEVS